MPTYLTWVSLPAKALPLTAGETSSEIWLAYQMHRADLDEGILVIFRRPDSPYEKAVFSLKGLSEDASAVYAFEDVDTGKVVDYSAADLRSGMHIQLDQPRTSLLLFYKRKK